MGSRPLTPQSQRPGPGALRRHSLSAPEVAHIRAQWPAALAFAHGAEHDHAWWTAINAVRLGQRDVADVARAYARYHAAFDRFAGDEDEQGLIKTLAAASPGSGERFVLWATLGTVSAWVAASVPVGLPQNALQRRTFERAERGTELVLRRGAGRCLACGAQLGALRRAIEGRPGTAARDYCDPCERRDGWERATRARRDRAAIDAVLDDLAAGHPPASRASRRRRARLSAP